jgi:hypothetical protein
VPRPGRCPWLAPLLLALLGASPEVCPAVAAGCHVADRPALGLTIDWNAPGAGSVAAIPPTARLGRLPCSKHSPGSIPSSPPDAPIVGAEEPPLPAAMPGCRLSVRVGEPLHPRHDSSVRPRPPRTTRRVA